MRLRNYKCVKCQDFHILGTRIYDEHLRFQSKEGISELW